jgi:hypothetical protein
MGYPSVRYTLDDLFGSERIRAVYDLPCHLGYLTDKLNRSGFEYSADELIRKHTLFPLYERFIAPELAHFIYNRMIKYSSQNLQSYLGLTASHVPMLKRFKYCPECNSEFLSKYVELYIHRVHQNSCVFVCPYHGTPLLDTNIDLNRNSQRCFVYPEMSHMKRMKTLENLNLNILHKVAKAFDYIIAGNFDCSYGELQNKYVHLLYENGLYKQGRGVDVKRLKGEFVDIYGHELLKRFGSVVDDKVNNWLFSIFRKQTRLFHPVRHILVILFLSGSLEEFTSYVPDGRVKIGASTGKRRFSLGRCRIDWVQRDRDSLSKVKKVVKDMLMLKSPFVRLTEHSVCKRTGEGDRILKSLNKLQLTKQYLSSITESHLQFQYRKVDRVIKSCGELTLTKELIYKKASVSKRRYPEVDDYINNLMVEREQGRVSGIHL